MNKTQELSLKHMRRDMLSVFITKPWCMFTGNAAIKNKKSLWCAETWMDLEGMVLNEVG